MEPRQARAEEKGGEVTAKDRVLMRRQEKQAREDLERAEALREAETENRQLRQAANQQQRSQFHAPEREKERNGNTNGRGGGGGRPSLDGDERKGVYEPSAERNAGRQQPQQQAAPRNGAGMCLDELVGRLSDATKGSQSRYTPASYFD
jgi:hypothetical protein